MPRDRPSFTGLRIASGLLLMAASVRGAPLFEDSIAPLLKEHCVDCHHPENPKGELDLSTAEAVLRGGESGPIVVASHPEESLLYEQVHRGEMPKKGGPLSESEQKRLRDWIAGGAQFRTPPLITEAGPNQHDVIPLLLLRCAACHGAQQQAGGLDLRTVESMRRGGDSGPAFVSGNPGRSRLIQRIETEACPPQALLLKAFVKRPSASEFSTIHEWIAAGAPEEVILPDVATTTPDILVTAEDRQHWAFQPPTQPGGPASVDQFVWKRLTEAGLDFSPEADRETLIRRAWFDLLGLPPSPEEWKYWKAADGEDWFSRMIDHLLESPHYGERWGRYWLDLAGYADSEGGTSADPLRPVAWKYRDYVVAAFNEDKPYDRFLIEQIAGDELVDVATIETITEEMVEHLVATGFLRMGIDETGSRTMNFVENRVGVIADAIEVLGSSVMGLTLECVRCHSHKYDPIPQRDYYRLKAVFQGALDEHDWLSFKNRTLTLGTNEDRRQVESVNPPLEAERQGLESAKRKKTIQWQRAMLIAHYPNQSAADRDATFVALKKADNTRSLPQRRLVEKLQRAQVIPLEEQPLSVQQAHREVTKLEEALLAVERQMLPPLTIRALWDRGDPSPTYIHRRGVPTNPGRLVGPGVPSVLTDGRTPFAVAPPFPADGTPKTGRRLAFANWLTAPDHPLTARVMVNRIWYHHFGRGIVPTLENFGLQGSPPTHPELLDWLATEFADRGWSIKEMHRLMMNSQTWKQSSQVHPTHLKQDPENQWFSRMPLRRLDAEALRDSLIQVAGVLDPRLGGPPDRVLVSPDGSIHAPPGPKGKWRRSLYLRHRRTEMPTMLETFDYPEMGPNCVERSVSTVSLQGLLLMNQLQVREWAESLAKRVGQRGTTSERVASVYEFALGRSPTEEELLLGVEALEQLQRDWPDNPEGAFASYCHAILNSAAFLYVD